MKFAAAYMELPFHNNFNPSLPSYHELHPVDVAYPTHLWFSPRARECPP